jgi:DNA-directed RNA polymerase specialized sigma subunit
VGSSISEAVAQIVALRRVRSAVESKTERRRLAQVIRQLRRQLGVGVAKRQAAAALGVSVQALDRWIGAGKIPAVRRPGSSRDLVETEALLLLAEEVTPLRERGESRALAKAIAALAARDRLPRRMRPNQSAQELRYEFLHSTPAGRMRQAIELSHVGAALAANAPARRR